MRVVSIGLGAFAIGMLIAVSVFAKAPETKSDKSSQATPAAQAPKPHRVRVKEDVQKAGLVHMISPMYPSASAKRMGGTVVLRVIIGQNGAVRSARYVSGPENLTKSAKDAVLQWRYKPTMVNGIPVEVDTTVSVVFAPFEKVEPPAANK
jgi:TonB family protein